MAEEHKARLNRRSRNHIKRLLVMWYGQLEREQIPARFNDVLCLSSSVGPFSVRLPDSGVLSGQASSENPRR
jgi:hypothetical protein